MSSLDQIPPEDVEVIADQTLSAEDIGSDRIHDLFQQVFFSSNNNNTETNNNEDAADDRDIDSEGNSRSPARPTTNDENYANEDELAALLGDDDDGTNKQQQQNDYNDNSQQELNQQVEDIVNDVLAEEGLDAAAGGDGDDDAAGGEDIFDWDKISENEEQERQYEDFDDEDDEFKNWIRDDILDRDQEAADAEQEEEDIRSGRIPQALAEARAALVQANMTKMAATEDDAQIVRSSWPERLKELELIENRPGLRGSKLPDGSTVELSREAEAFWILRMLCQPGYPFERRAHIVQEVMKQQQQYPNRPNPIIKSIEYALECFVEEQLEPAYLMLYRSSQFVPLIAELLKCDSESRDAPDAWYGYCANTGRRQSIQNIQTCRTELTTVRGSSVGSGYEGFRDFERHGQPVIRRPAFIPLGRLLGDILQLDGLCNRLERHRHITLEIMNQMNSNSNTGRMMMQHQQQQYQQSSSTNHLRWFAPTKHDIEHLSQIVFESPHSSDVWSEYAEFFHRMQLAFTHYQQGTVASVLEADSTGVSWARSPSCRLILLGVSRMFEDYAIPGPYLQENVITGQIVNITQNRQRLTHSPLQWAEDVISTLDPTIRPTAEGLLRLFNDALVEQLSSLPFVREAAMSVFVSEGRCEVAPSARSADQQLRVTTIQSLLHRDPALFLELLEEEAGGSCILNFAVDITSIERVLPIMELLQGCGISAQSNSEEEIAWQRQLLRCREPAARRLQSTLRSHVRVLLHESATRAVSKKCASNLANLLAEGCYEPTTVRLNKEPRPDINDQLPQQGQSQQQGQTSILGEPQPFAPRGSEQNPAAAPLWPTAYEITEALPVKGVSTARVDQSQRHRVCSCVRVAGGVTVFAFIDSFGMLRHVVRWVDTVNKSEGGREVQQAQYEQLRRACRQFEPEVVAIAPTGDMRQTWNLYKDVQHCLARDHELENQTSGASVIQANINVVFASPVIAKLIAASSAIIEEFPNTDPALRITVSLARHTQDPLRSVCSLFDNSENGGLVGRLPIGCEMFRESVLNRSSLYKKLEWEMVLWVAASGVDATALLGVPPLFAERQLQFVPGLGRRKAARLMQVLRQLPQRLLSRKELAVIMLMEFGGGALPAKDICNQTNEERANLRSGKINSTVANASPCMRVRPSERNASYGSGNKSLTPNLTSLYPKLAGQQEDREQDENMLGQELADALVADMNKDELLKSICEDLDHHLLDETLVPLEWYGVAMKLCAAAIGSPAPEFALAACKLNTLRKRHEEFARKFRDLTQVVSIANDVAASRQQDSYLTNDRNRSFFGVSEIDFVIDELISFGAVRARRAYRKMTDARFFALVTGHTFVENRRKVSSDKKHQSAVLCLGDIIEGTPVSVSISSRDNSATLRLQGSKGLVLSMPVEQLPSELSSVIRTKITEAERMAYARGSDRVPNSIPAPAALKSLIIHGRLTQVDLSTGDARVSYEANPASAMVSALALASLNNNGGQQQANKLLGLDSSRSRESGDIQSIKSMQLTVPSKGNALRASSHVLYRNISNESAKSMLENCEIGEAIIRPCSQLKYGDIVVVVKVGLERDSIVNIPVFEDRKSSGVTYYRFVDVLAQTSTVSKHLEFEDIDHLLQNYIRVMGKRYRELAEHRHYYPTREMMREEFDSKLQEVPNAFVYGIVETPDHARCKYAVVYRSGKGGREREVKVCASAGQLLMQNPRDLDHWTRHGDAEGMVRSLKNILCGNSNSSKK